MNIEGTLYTGFIDYDRVRLRTATPSARIRWLEYRVEKVLIGPLDQILPPAAACHNQVNAAGNTFNLCGVTLVACAIEGLGHFLTGRDDNNGASFKAWVTRYMPQWNKRTPNGVRVNDWLWDSARNGLAHQLAFKTGGTEDNGGLPYEEKRDGQIQMNPFRFYADFKTGVGLFFRELETNVSMQTAFEARFMNTLLT
jgi:hypothetical protein